uniref:Uncharacterized protein n=1 Tax=Vitis vinifera TaxID=29760 RepID=A5C220_VITVI|nr:hypothetical protein VITISV_023231 [Vitis vinifera]
MSRISNIGEMQRSSSSCASVDPTVKRPPIIIKFPTVIVFNMVNTSMESDFRSHDWIFLYRVKPLTWGHESSSGLPKIWGVTKIVCNKEVQWSSFYFDWAQNGSNGFGSYSDFFSEMETPRDTKLELGTGTDSPKSLAACSIPWKLKCLSTESVSNGKEEITRGWKNESPSGLRSSGSKHKNKLNKIVTERKYRSKSGSDYGQNASDGEIRRRLSKLNKKFMDSASDSCEDLDRSSEGGSSGSEGYDQFVMERNPGFNWLFPFYTQNSLCVCSEEFVQKYEVIEQYAIVADEDEVQRKMKVSLPEGHNEKLSAQKNGTEESDMEIPNLISGTPLPYPALYPHEVLYAHPSMATAQSVAPICTDMEVPTPKKSEKPLPKVHKRETNTTTRSKPRGDVRTPTPNGLGGPDLPERESMFGSMLDSDLLSQITQNPAISQMMQCLLSSLPGNKQIRNQRDFPKFAFDLSSCTSGSAEEDSYMIELRPNSSNQASGTRELLLQKLHLLPGPIPAWPPFFRCAIPEADADTRLVLTSDSI